MSRLRRYAALVSAIHMSIQGVDLVRSGQHSAAPRSCRRRRCRPGLDLPRSFAPRVARRAKRLAGLGRTDLSAVDLAAGLRAQSSSHDRRGDYQRGTGLNLSESCRVLVDPSVYKGVRRTKNEQPVTASKRAFGPGGASWDRSGGAATLAGCGCVALIPVGHDVEARAAVVDGAAESEPRGGRGAVRAVWVWVVESGADAIVAVPGSGAELFGVLVAGVRFDGRIVRPADIPFLEALAAAGMRRSACFCCALSIGGTGVSHPLRPEGSPCRGGPRSRAPPLDRVAVGLVARRRRVRLPRPVRELWPVRVSDVAALRDPGGPVRRSEPPR